MAANSAVRSWIWLIFKLCQDLVVVVLTCKNEEDSIKSECARVTTRLYVDFSVVQVQITSPLSMVASGRNLNSFKHLCMPSLPAKKKEDSIKNEGARVATTYLPL